MITFNPDTNVLHLTNGYLSYMVYINHHGYLETLYFGKAMGDIGNTDSLRRATPWHDSGYYYDNDSGQEHEYEDGYMSNYALQELSAHARSDKRHAPLVVRQHDGSYETDFRYVSHTVKDGVPSVPDMPHAHDGQCQTVDFLLRDAYGLEAHYYLTIFADKNVLLKSFCIKNPTTYPVYLRRAMSMQLDLPTAEYDLVHFWGRWQKEREYCRVALHDGVQEISSNQGRSSHEENPFVYLQQPTATSSQGEVIGFNLIYSGNFAFRAQATVRGSTHITYGINDEDFEWLLGPNEQFATPQAVIAYSADGVDGMSQTMHRFVRQNVMTWDNSRAKPILFNSWEGCFFDFDTQRVLSYIDDAATIGTQLFVLDDGWFGARNDDTAGLGDWKVNAAKLDLHRVMERCRQHGMHFGIWFEPEMVNFDSDLFRRHPQYALTGANTHRFSSVRHQFHLDFANPVVVDEVYRQLKAFFDEYPVDYIKWDYNRIICEHYSPALPAERQGEVYHRATLGYYRLLGRIRAEYPDMVIEGCASGGGRFDLGTLYYTPQIWASDESDPAQRMEINYTTSLGYPLSAIGAHVNASPVADYRTKAILALFGTYGYEMNPNKLSDEEREQLRQVADVYHQYHKDVVENGTLYHLLNPYEGNYMSMQCVSCDKQTSLVVIINRRKELDRFRYLRLRGLKKDALYYNDYEDAVHTGEYYMNIGINYSREWLAEFACRLIVIKQVSK